MKYFSTRGGIADGVTFEAALTSGYAADGGLYVPETVPEFTRAEMLELARLPYRELATRVAARFVGDEVPTAELRRIFDVCYRDCPEEVVSMKNMEGYCIAELFRGPTHCFKDLSIAVVVGLLGFFCERRRQKAGGGSAAGGVHTILASTSGDTGPAIVRAVAGLGDAAVRCHIFFPQGHVSRTQMLQMTTAVGPQVKVSPYEGGGDDMDLPIKRLQQDRAFAEKHGVMGCNSYNVARPVLQAIHYFWTYFRGVELRQGVDWGALKAEDTLPEVVIVLPVGAMGNTVGGMFARMMGVPITRVCAGTNANDITHRVISAGEFHRAEAMRKTLSDAINVQVPYNFERVLYYTLGRDPALIKAMMADVDQTGKLTLTPEQLGTLRLLFDSARVSDDATLHRLRAVCNETGYIACPHTAVALDAAAQLGCGAKDETRTVVVFSTASPCKFEESVTLAIGEAGWAKFRASAEFPESAKYEDTTEEQEKPALAYRALPGADAASSLAASQSDWEAKLRASIDPW